MRCRRRMWGMIILWKIRCRIMMLRIMMARAKKIIILRIIILRRGENNDIEINNTEDNEV